MPRQIKQLNDSEKQKAIEVFVRNTFKDRDDYMFDFEADFVRMLKKLNVRRLVNGDRKYLRKFTKAIMEMYRKVYFPETLKAGKRQTDRFVRLFT